MGGLLANSYQPRFCQHFKHSALTSTAIATIVASSNKSSAGQGGGEGGSRARDQALVAMQCNVDSTARCGSGSVQFGYCLGVERFEWFQFSDPAVPLGKGFVCPSA